MNAKELKIIAVVKKLAVMSATCAAGHRSARIVGTKVNKIIHTRLKFHHV